MLRRWSAPALVLLILILAGCKRSPVPTTEPGAGPAWFADVTDEVGLDFLHDPGPIDGKYFMPQIMGSGAAFLDYDRDGWLDLVVVGYLDLDPTQVCSRAGTPDYCHPELFKGTITRLFRNRGRDREGKWLGFEDRTDAAGLGRTPGPGLGVVC